MSVGILHNYIILSIRYIRINRVSEEPQPHSIQLELNVCAAHNRATLSPTKVGAGHPNDVHPPNDVFYPNRSTTSSTEAPSSYSTSKTVIHLSIHS